MPIKRSEQIKPLSREHHIGLLFCWKLRMGVKKEIANERLKRYVNFFAQHHLYPHFQTEEDLLQINFKHKMSERVFEEHTQIRSLITTINNSNSEKLNLYSDLASLIDDHIRFEERQLFPLLESNIKQAALNEIGKRLAENEILQENYDDEFWSC